MREIKFRQHIPDEGIYIWGTINHRIFNHPKLDGNMKYYPSEEYTGMKDKNGADIYEGDIVTSADTNKNYIIKWNNPKCEFSAYCQNLELISNVLFVETKEVIGNIHENPELAVG